MKLVKIQQLTGIIRLRSGLHIGAGKDNVEIGGLDQPVIKDPVTTAPYIPGSSLKGKMRFLLETSLFMKNEATRKAVMDGKPCGCGRAGCPACTIFGSHSANREDGLGPTRLIVRDAMLTPECLEQFHRGKLPMEVKNENIINRVTGTAEHPRPLERVPAGTCFTLNIAFRVYEGDDASLWKTVLQGLKLIELDALGGGGSRGNGQVEFQDLQIDGKPIDLKDIAVF
ncbi:MAG: type III-A CRISPR-associated RAMP protein Csm3 [Desulfovibrionaceae bacterium]|nr:type III-A CRISPR-associated RAMP protein Csm3 [Desulfovibrionaceae bacterium]